MTDQAGVESRFDYLVDPAHYLSEVIGPHGPTQRTEFDEQGRLVATIDALGNRVQQLWDPANFAGTITDANGNETHLIYDREGMFLSRRTRSGTRRFSSTPIRDIQTLRQGSSTDADS